MTQSVILEYSARDLLRRMASGEKLYMRLDFSGFGIKGSFYSGDIVYKLRKEGYISGSLKNIPGKGLNIEITAKGKELVDSQPRE